MVRVSLPEECDPYKLITGGIYFSKELKESYIIGTKLAVIAVQLSEKLNDPETKWEFINIIARSNQEELLPNLLNSKFKPFFEKLTAKQHD